MCSFLSSIPFTHDGGNTKDSLLSKRFGDKMPTPSKENDSDNNNDSIVENKRNPLWQCALAGGLGCVIGDSVMHSLDTVKTRQQGAPNIIKYRNMWHAYRTIYLEEGICRGLYSGYTAAMLGSFPGAAMFFGSYEYTKRLLIDQWNLNDSLSHLTAGFIGDFVSSIVYVPSEVLKSRLQLQGRYNNPHFNSGYNYRNLRHSIQTIIKEESWSALYFGYKATLIRDLPFSALQLAFYEKFRQWAFLLEDKLVYKHDLSIANEILTGACAGGFAGIITTPLDVIKTRLQTQQPSSIGDKGKISPSVLTNSIGKSLQLIYRNEGIWNLLNGVGPRFVWTSVQSSIMLLLYQVTLKLLNRSQYY